MNVVLLECTFSKLEAIEPIALVRNAEIDDHVETEYHYKIQNG